MVEAKAKVNYSDQSEMIALIIKSKAGDKGAEEAAVKRNVGLVAAVVRKFLNRGYEYDDLFQIGCIGLIKAIKNFNPQFEVRFSTYAVPMIMGEIKRFLRDDGLIKVSRNLKETAKKVRRTKEVLSKQYGREVTISEIAKELCITSEEVVVSLESTLAPEYLYDTIHQDDGNPVMLIDRLCEEKDYGLEITDRIAIKDIINSLDPKARQVIMLRYFKDMTQSQIAQIIGISQVQVSRIEKKVLERIRNDML